MAHFYGTVEGRARTLATREGSEGSGLTTIAASYAGAIEVRLFSQDGKDKFVIEQIPWLGVGERTVIAVGTVGVAYGQKEGMR